MVDLKIIEVKSEIGAGTRGASLGVEALKIASLDLGSDFFKYQPTVEVQHVNELLFDGARHAYAKFIDGVLIMEERVCETIYTQLKEGFFPMVMAGDHSTAYGTLSGIKKAFPDKRIGVVWIDAHADIHSPYTTQSGNMHGMSLAMACGIDNLECQINMPREETLVLWEQIKQIGMNSPKVRLEDIVYIALRDVEKPENHLIQQYGIAVIETEDVRLHGAKAMALKALEILDACDLIYVSFDVDSIDSRITRGTGTPVPHGLTIEEACDLNWTLAQSPKLCAWEIVEVNPTLDTENLMAESAFKILEGTARAVLGRNDPGKG